MSKRLYKTTIVVYTTEHTLVDGDEWDIETLARESRDDGAYIGSQVCEQVQEGEVVPEEVFSYLSFSEINTSEPEPDDDSDWREELAMQVGMTGGCDAYNEAIGSPTGRPAGSRYGDYDDDEG